MNKNGKTKIFWLDAVVSISPTHNSFAQVGLIGKDRRTCFGVGFNFRVKVIHKTVTPSPSATVNVKREVSDNDLDLKFMHFCPDQTEFVDILSKEQLKRMIRERRNSTGRLDMTEEQRQRLLSQREVSQRSVGMSLWSRASGKMLSSNAPEQETKKYCVSQVHNNKANTDNIIRVESFHESDEELD